MLYGYSMFVFLSASNYVAQSIKIYSKVTELPLVASSLRDLNLSGYKLCLLDSLYPTVAHRLPAKNVMRLDGYGPVFEHLLQGNCSASIVGKNQFQAFVRESRATFTVCMHKTDPFGFEKCQDSKVAPKPFEVIPGASACTAKKDKVSESGSG